MKEKQPKPIFISMPCSKESEMMILGCMLTTQDYLRHGSENLSQNDFFFNEHKTIFQVLKNTFEANKPGDIHLIAEELKRKKELISVGGVGYLTSLAQYAGTSAYIEEYCKIIQDKSHSRQAIHLLEKGREEYLKDDLEDPSKKSEKYYQKFLELVKRYSPNDKISVREILSGIKLNNQEPIIKQFKQRKESYKKDGKPHLTGLSTGYIDFDANDILLKPSNLIVVAGRPSMGKTAFVLNVLLNICFDKHKPAPVGFISIETEANQLVERMFSIKTDIAGIKLNQGTFDDDELKKLEKENEKLNKINFLIHDHGISRVSQVASRARRLKDENDIQVLAIDYIQLLNTDKRNDNRQYEIAEVSRMLKQLAMELKIPVIAISQLSRKVEERSNKRPLMSDLRDSGQIEQDADVIVFVHREDYYDSQVEPGIAEVYVAKNRLGSLPSVKLQFNKDCGKFNNHSSLEASDGCEENTSLKFSRHNSSE